jgi:hypothetical protein
MKIRQRHFQVNEKVKRLSVAAHVCNPRHLEAEIRRIIA